MRERAEELKQRVRETPLNDRLDDARRRIGKMCSEGRPPRMTIPVQYDDDDFYISTTLSDAQATIADLQGQVVAWHKRLQEADEAYYAVGELNDALQQRVAQLEGERDMYKRSSDTFAECVDNVREAMGLETTHYLVLPDDVAELKADHARLLGLVQALPKFECELYVMSWPSGQAAVYQRNQENKAWHCESREHAEALKCLLEYRASLPAQPAQGGASKPVTTCNRHSDCDAADEKARAKGALHADHCHDDCCSECFGN